MKAIKLFAAILLALALMCSAALAELELDLGSTEFLGQPLEDFIVDTIDGKGFTLSETLKDHDMVYIVLWATWCENCDESFAQLQQAWEKYGDRVAVLALSVEEEDTDEALKSYAEARGLTFAIGRDTAGLAEAFGLYSVPYIAVVDRFGCVAYAEIGGPGDQDALERLFGVFLDESYTETVVLDAIPGAIPDVEAADEAALSEAANAEGGALRFTNPTDAYTWPMLPTADGDRTALVSTNAGRLSTSAAVYTQVTASEGDVLAFDFRTSTEGAIDLLEIAVDGEVVKAFGGEHDWTSWAVALPAGEHELAFTYTEDEMISGGEDKVWLDNIRLAGGDEGAALLAALPALPVGDGITLSLAGDGVEEVKLDDPDGIMKEYFNCDTFWSVTGDAATARITIAGDLDPERVFLFRDYDEAVLPLNAMLLEDGSAYEATIDLSMLKESEEGYIGLMLYPGLRDEDADRVVGAMVVQSGETALNMLNEVLEAGEEVDLSEAEESDEQIELDEAEFIEEFGDIVEAEEASEEAEDAEDTEDTEETGDAEEAEDTGDSEGVEGVEATASDTGEATYIVTFVDQNGDPVPGCYVNFCTDESCQPVQSDENGVASLTGEPYPYHLQVLKVPEGYTFDVSQEYTANEAGENLILVVTKD